MDEPGFKTWLEARRWNGKPLSSIPSRMAKARKFERAMPALGLGNADLDAAFDADGMHVVTERLREWCRQAARTGAAPVELVGQTTSAAMRISNVASAVRNYRQFREGVNTPAGAWPALEELRAAFLDRVPEFERFDLTDNDYERVERAYKDALIAKVHEIAASGDDDEQAGRRIYRTLIPSEGALLSWQVEDDFMRKHGALAPAFFATIGRLARSTEPVVDAVMTATAEFEHLYAQGAVGLTLGQVSRIALTVRGVMRPDEAAPFAITKAQQLARLLGGDPIFTGSTLTRAMVERWLELLRRVETVMRDDWGWAPRDLIDVQGFAWTALDERWGAEDEDADALWFVTARNGEADGLDHFVARGEWHLLGDRGNRINALVREMTPGDRIVLRDYFVQRHDLPFDARGKGVSVMRLRATGIVTEQRGDGVSIGVDWTVLPEPRLWYFYTNNDPVWRPNPERQTAQRLAAFVLDDEPQDYAWFLARWGLTDDLPDTEADPDPKDITMPTNLILHGPPGTGKTYATAEHGVRLCGEAVDGLDRAALMAKYMALSEAGRIEFVTFHQSTAYEEFVEGLRPVQGGEGAAGFELQPTDGIFRRIAGRAEIGASIGGGSFTLGDRQVFKMSIGDATKAEWAWLFDEAIEHGYAYLGFADIDWSDQRFAKRDAILAELQSFEGHHGAFDDDAQLSLQAGPVKSPDLFRNELRIGDVIVVSKGLTLFRAIGVVEGDYEYERRADGRYSHRRKVRWLWHDEDGVPVSELNSRRFSIETIYRLKRANLNVPALERYANSQQETTAGAPEPFVLVIDEINRANISKVFGELITLLEPDKRIGAENELRVRLPYSGELFGVPANLHIIGTMNTADRSIALIDKALRRRFDFVEMMPDYTVRGMADEVAGAGVTLADVLRTLNDRIEYLLDREHQIGHAWLLGCDTKAKLDAKMRSAVIPLIAEYFFEDWGRTADVLGGRDANPFLDARSLAPPPGMAVEEPRVRWSVKPEFAQDAYLRLIAKG